MNIKYEKGDGIYNQQTSNDLTKHNRILYN